MDRFELTRLLIEKVEEYASTQEDKNSLSIESYVTFLQSKKSIEEYKNSFLKIKEYVTSEMQHHIPNNIERVISQHLLFLYRYIKFYSKHIFQDSKIRSVDDFGIMMTVMQHHRISKSDLIKKNIFEKSSGIEIINRLVKYNLLHQQSNPNDNRSQLISLSEEGKMTVFQLFKKMDILGYITTGELNEMDKHQLASILKKLDHFHYDNYQNKKLKSLEDYLPKNFKNDLPSQ